ncbi:hypothetical protein DBR44_16250 [Aquitalea sp. FJL05]|uniref:head-tail connector protein n=1 Tax=Aquitalea sp. FJL05 TaxID=2153366 RepID=UPI000F5B00B8|nr:head-tail connector protein [Aquitalea sp. FJL05]RQO68224.1 hypothetical protein DBR44_16250 [Aquitalea sp. FJL05]
MAAILMLDEIKQQCRIEPDQTEEDDLLQQMEAAAVRACEDKIGGPLLHTPRQLVLSRWPLQGFLLLPTPNAFQVDRVEILQQGVMQEWTSWSARAEPESNALYLYCRQAWPLVDQDSDAIRIRYQAGLAASGEGVPEAVRQWLRFRVATYYQYREQFVSGNVANLGTALVDSLLHAYQFQEVVL